MTRHLLPYVLVALSALVVLFAYHFSGLAVFSFPAYLAEVLSPILPRSIGEIIGSFLVSLFALATIAVVSAFLCSLAILLPPAIKRLRKGRRP